MLHKG